MTQEQQRIAIARACGWTHIVKENEEWAGRKPGTLATPYLPDYLHDLNACHEMEKVIPKEIFSRYMSLLTGIVSRDRMTERDHFANRSTATAAQRCEAFLKTLNIYK